MFKQYPFLRSGRSFLFCFLLFAGFILFLNSSRTMAETKDSSGAFHAIIISDLHFCRDGSASDAVVPGMAFSEEITDAIVSEVIALHPDVFIMTGDNTNSSSAEDQNLLARKLQQIKDAGISLIITTGNHDLNQSGEKAFEEVYFPLLDPADRDENSLSYTAVIDDIVFLAMDDNAVTLGGYGQFSPETMAWLKQMLTKYGGRKRIFLSHHNVTAGTGDTHSESYRIQNEELTGILTGHDVRLALTGHLHYQSILEENGLYEIISSMPFSRPHQMGFLEIEGNRGSYHTEPIDLKSYGIPGLSEIISYRDRLHNDQYRESFRELLARVSDRPEKEKDQILDLILEFFSWFEEGTLASHAEEIMSRPAYPWMIDTLWDLNYGPWMKSAVETAVMDANQLEFTF